MGGLDPGTATMAADPIFHVSIYCVRTGDRFRPHQLARVVYDMLVDTRVVRETHWDPPPPIPHLLLYVRRGNRYPPPPPPPYPHPDGPIYEVD